MPWLRLDDTFLEHPKLIGLTDRQVRQHLAAMLYAARHRTGGALPVPALRALRIPAQTANVFVKNGLWDRDETGALFVHDFDEYNPTDTTQADRAKRYRDRKKSASSQEPDRDASRVTGRDAAVTRHVTPLARAQAAARVPSPTPSAKATAAELDLTTNGDREPAAANLEQHLDQLGLGPEWIQAAQHDPDRANAWLERTREKATRNPAGYFRSGFETGQWPTTTTPRIAPDQRRESYVRTVGHRLEDDHLADTLRTMGATDDDVVELLDLAANLRP